MKVALCYSGQVRTLSKTVEYHNKFISDIKDEFDTVVVGCTDSVSTYPNNENKMTRGQKHYDSIIEPLDMNIISAMSIDNIFIDHDRQAYNTEMKGFADRDIHYASQYWKHAKAASLAPDADIYVRCRWDVSYAWETSRQVIDNIHALTDKHNNTISPCTEVLLIGLHLHSNKGNMFCDYGNTIISRKAQEHFNMNWLDAVRNTEGNNISFHFTQTWINSFLSKEKNISIASAPYNKAKLYNIVRPEWYVQDVE